MPRCKRSAKRSGDLDLLEKNFTTIYQLNIWGNKESVSGPGSTLRATRPIRRELPKLLHRLKVKTLLDAPCGDFNWMRQVKLGIESYIGVDVVRDLIEKNHSNYRGKGRKFIHRNIISDKLPRADLILCRDVMMHLPFKAAFCAIENFRKTGAKYLLISTDERSIVDNRKDLPPGGGWRPVNLRLSPFNFPAPVHTIKEEKVRGREVGQILALWRIDDIPKMVIRPTARTVIRGSKPLVR